MNKTQYLLTKLAEECSELAQIALKTQQFGLHEVCPNQPYTNFERIVQEFNDLLGVVDAINDDLSGTAAIKRSERMVLDKRDKIDKYYQYSIECGQVKE